MNGHSITTTWATFEREAPELAASARRYLDAGKHKTLATLRADGSPRISGTEADIVDGELCWGSMLGARKARDLQRDGRFALHSASIDPPAWTGDAKVAGIAVEVDDARAREALVAAQGYADEPSEAYGEFHLFRAEIREVSVTELTPERDAMIIRVWRPGEPVREMRR